MSYLPNIRDKKSGAYYEGCLDGEQYAALVGFDMAVDAVCDFFNNLEAYDYPDKNTNKAEFLTKTKPVLESKKDILEWLEMCRNELGISLLESQDD